MLTLIVINLVVMAVSLGLLSLIYALQQSVPVVIALIFVSGIVISILALASGEVASSAANFGSAHIADFFRAIPSCIADGIRFGLVLAVVGAAAYVCIPFYFAQKTLVAIFIGAMFVWLVVFTLLSLQWLDIFQHQNKHQIHLLKMTDSINPLFLIPSKPPEVSIN